MTGLWLRFLVIRPGGGVIRLLFFDALPVSVISVLSFSNELLEVSRRVTSGPEVLDAVWEAVVVQVVEDVVRPACLISSFPELDCIAMYMVSLFHL